MKFCLYSSYLIDVFIMLIIKQSETAGQKRLFQKINDLEIEVRRENVRRQEEIRGLQQSVDRIEEQLNNTVSILDKALTALTDTKTVGTQIVNDPKDVGKIGNVQTNSGKLGEVLGAFKILKRGFSEEKKETSRLRRHMTEIQSQMDDQRTAFVGISNGVSSILKLVETITYEMNTTNNDIKDIKETGVINSKVIHEMKQNCNLVADSLYSDILEGSRNFLNSTCSKDDIQDLRNQLVDSCKKTSRKSCRKIIEAGCVISDVYGLSLGSSVIQVITGSSVWFFFKVLIF